MNRSILCILFASLLSCLDALQFSSTSRRAFLTTAKGTAAIALCPQISNAAASAPSLNFSESKSGIQYADAKLGSGSIPQPGSTVSIDYVLSTTGARYGSSIYKTADKGAPYRWTIGDGSTIRGLEEVILGSEGMPPMQAGGIRRAVIPPALAYEQLMDISQDCGQKGNNGPVPPPSEAFEEFQRFKNIYCNPNRAYQPDVVIDVKLYGRRTTN